MRCFVFISCILLTSLNSSASAQHPAATTVQLPSFEFFTIDTTVSVPDCGSVTIGGSNGKSLGSTAYGPPLLPQRASGSGASAGQMQVRATIHDFEAFDAALLKSDHNRTLFSKDNRSLVATEPSSGSVKEARAARAQELADEQQKAAAYFAQGLTAEAQGKPNVAHIYYQMALRRASGDLKTQIQAQLDRVTLPAGSVAARPASR
jgi:hypothetical protein